MVWTARIWVLTVFICSSVEGTAQSNLPHSAFGWFTHILTCSFIIYISCKWLVGSSVVIKSRLLYFLSVWTFFFSCQILTEGTENIFLSYAIRGAWCLTVSFSATQSLTSVFRRRGPGPHIIRSPPPITLSNSGFSSCWSSALLGVTEWWFFYFFHFTWMY